MAPLYCYRAQVLRVVDAGTLDLLVDLGFSVQIRVRAHLYGVEVQEAGDEGREFVEQWLGMVVRTGERFCRRVLNPSPIVARFFDAKAVAKEGSERWRVRVERDGNHLGQALIDAGYARRAHYAEEAELR